MPRCAHIVMVLSATVIPVELRAPTYEPGSLSVSANLVSDVLANILGYVPVGMVLWGLGPARAITTAALIAALAETAQLFMVHRDPSIVDVLANVVGTILGVVIASYWQIRPPALLVSKPKSQIALLLAVAIVAGGWKTSGETPSARGVTLPGRLEAYWKLDEGTGRVAKDSSGHRLDGRFGKDPKRVGDVAGRAVRFDSAEDYVDFGRPTALRLVGSMTISAWIKSTSYPVDDAAIVSSFSGAAAGYQLDSSDDRGPRTIGFKIANECGRLAVRYGSTSLAAGTWYHVAGVYDSEMRALDVYLNGALNNGFLLGTVTGAQHSSRSPVYIGRRSDMAGFEFAGLIRDVRIYSRALKPTEIVIVMGGRVAGVSAPVNSPKDVRDDRRGQTSRDLVRAACAISSDKEDKYIPIAAAAVGLLVAIAGIGLWPHSSGVVWLVASLTAGIVLLVSMLPAINLWLVPLASLAGGASVVVSIRRAS